MNPLLRRNQTILPTEKFSDYGSLIKSKQRKYRTAEGAFGVTENFNFKPESNSKLFYVFLALIFIIFGVFVKASAVKQQ
jgi:hypothetical protein